MHNIAIVVSSSVRSIDLIGPIEVFGEAASLLGDGSAYNIEILGESRDPIQGTYGLRFLPDRTIHEIDRDIDTLLIPGSVDTPVEPVLTEWLRERAGSLRRCAAIGCGVFLLGEAGLIDGRRVTTNIDDAARLAARYPRVTIEHDRIFVRDGFIYSSAGATAGMDLALALVEEDFGRNLALDVARRLVMFLKRSGGQSQISPHLSAQLSAKPLVQQIQEWMLENLASRQSSDLLAKRAGMSKRNFFRVFLREAKMTPAEFLEMARLHVARRMLEDTDMPLQRLAYRCGFGRVETMRRAFVRNLGCLPTEYRKRSRREVAVVELRPVEMGRFWSPST
jgi:transcriptional regulator GlxA family with amidase domain